MWFDVVMIFKFIFPAFAVENGELTFKPLKMQFEH